MFFSFQSLSPVLFALPSKQTFYTFWLNCDLCTYLIWIWNISKICLDKVGSRDSRLASQETKRRLKLNKAGHHLTKLTDIILHGWENLSSSFHIRMVHASMLFFNYYSPFWILLLHSFVCLASRDLLIHDLSTASLEQSLNFFTTLHTFKVVNKDLSQLPNCNRF